MKKIPATVTIFLFLIAILVLAQKYCFATSFFTETANTNKLRSIYNGVKDGGPKLRILIVPGHDKDSWGTEYKNVKEADLNYQMATEIYGLLSKEKEYEVIMARDELKYTPELASYFETQKEAISNFRREHRQVLSILNDAKIIENNDKNYHNSVDEGMANKLYGINKWANENKIDLVLHIHFNDTPERKKWGPGEYNGFVVYVPNRQFSNAGPSIELGKSILDRMNTYFAVSDMPSETSGVVEDQKLIALGAMNTLNPAAVLVEYGYIYEPQIINSNVRPLYFKEVALQTVLGINNFFNNYTNADVATLPHKWSGNLKKGVKGSKDVFALQLALTLDGFYPPTGKNKNECSINGNYGSCTSLAVAQFQKDFGLTPVGISVGPKTRAKLNALYYNN